MADELLNNLVVNNTLGIGTPEPAAQLHISATEGISSKVFVESINGSLLQVTAEPNSASIGTENAFPLSINTNGLSRIQISSEGNVGVGTPPSTDAKLSVNGMVKATAFQGDGSQLTGKVNTAGDIMTGPLTIQSNLSISGNVGIGTAEPTNKLHVIGGGPVTIENAGEADILFKDTSSGQQWQVGTNSKGWYVYDNAYRFVVQKNSGNVGIGTAEPTNKLHVIGGGPVTIENAGEADILFKDTSSGQQWQVGTNSKGWYVYDNAYRFVVQKNSGNVGIGTHSPNFGLDVRGNNGWIGSADSSQSQGGWRLGRWPDYSPNERVYLTRADSTRYQDLAVKALWAGGDLRFGTADDLAEMTPVKAEDNLEPGDVVVIENPPDNRVLLARSNKPYDSKVAGVISDPITAGLIIGGSHPTDVNRDDIKPLALAGRVLTKVTTENGSINAGDFLTTSSTPGHAMKATGSGHTLGKALQSFNDDQNGETKGKIWVLVNLGMS